MGVSAESLCYVDYSRGKKKKKRKKEEEEREQVCVNAPHPNLTLWAHGSWSAAPTPLGALRLQRGCLDKASNIWLPREPGPFGNSETIAGLF